MSQEHHGLFKKRYVRVFLGAAIAHLAWAVMDSHAGTATIGEVMTLTAGLVVWGFAMGVSLHAALQEVGDLKEEVLKLAR